MNKSFKKIISLVLTVLMLAGTVTMLVPVSASSTLEQKTEYNFNGVKVRLDPHPNHRSASLTVNSDGSMKMKGSWGDLLWFPNVEVSSNSVITTTVTMDSSANTSKTGAGLVFAVNANGAWDENSDTAVFIGPRSPSGGKSRVFLAATSYEKATGSADFTTTLNHYKFDNQNENFGETWTPGHSVTTVVSQEGNIVKVSFKDENGTNITDKDYVTYDNANYPISGAVGFMTHYTSGDYDEYTIKEYKITNVKVDGVLVDELDIVEAAKAYYDKNFGDEPIVIEQKIAGNTDFPVNDLVLRMDYPTPDHSSSSLTLRSDGTIKMKGSRGDLFWLSNVELTADSVFTTTVTFDAAAVPNSCCAGTAYGIDANGAWDAEADTAIVAALRTYYNNYSRRSIATTNYTKATVNADFVTTLTDVNYTATNTDFGNAWQLGKTVTTVISQAANGTVSAVFTDGNGDAITSTSYNNSEYPLSGNVGYMTHWTNGSDYNEYTISEFKITNAKVNGVLVDEVDLIAEVVEYLNPNKGVTDESISLSLDGTIGLNFSFNADAGVPAGATVVATKNDNEVVNQAVVDGENLVTVPVAAKEMTDEINISIMVDGEVFDGKTYTATVKEYAEKLMADDNYNDWDELMNAMLNYGAAAQKLLDYKAEDADVSGVADYDFTEVADVTFDNGIKNVLKGLYMNLSLESDTVLNLYFMPADEVELSVKVNGETAKLAPNGDGYYVLSIEGIAADKLSEDFAITVNDTYLFEVNALNWAKLASSDVNENVATLAKALAIYSSCADEIEAIQKN